MIITRITMAHRQMEVLGLQVTRILQKYYGAVLGAAIRMYAVPPSAAPISPSSASTMASVFELWGWCRGLFSPLPFLPFLPFFPKFFELLWYKCTIHGKMITASS
jgi:hypothetical protein